MSAKSGGANVASVWNVTSNGGGNVSQMVLERLRRIVFEMLEESRARLTQAEEILRSPPAD